MRTRIMLCTGIVLCLVGTLHAATTWSGLDGGKWSDPANWSAELPSPTNKAFFQGPGACIVDFDGAAASQIDLAGGPVQIVDGGVLTVYSWFILGYAVGDVGELAGHLEVYDGGVLNCNVRFKVGFQGEGHLTVYEGGTVNLHTQQLDVGEHEGGTGSGFVELEGGSINLLEGTDAQSLDLYRGKASINFKGGTMTLRDTTENQDTLAMAIGDGIIKAYDGVGEVVVDPNETPGRIIIRGVHPLKPFPADDSTISAGDVDLSWVLPDPCQAGTPVTVDVYFTDDLELLEYFTDPAAIQVVSKQNVTSVVVQTQPKTRYYWAVDTYIGSAEDPVFGPIFSFVADNLPPRVYAGADVVTWLEDGSVEVAIAAAVTDTDPTTTLWTVITEPNEGMAVIANPDQTETTVTLSALGTYVLQLEADDGEYKGADTMTISVFSDQCEAAKSLPGWEATPGDINLDCVVDQLDMDILLEQWLECTGLDCPDPNAL